MRFSGLLCLCGLGLLGLAPRASAQTPAPAPTTAAAPSSPTPASPAPAPTTAAAPSSPTPASPAAAVPASPAAASPSAPAPAPAPAVEAPALHDAAVPAGVPSDSAVRAKPARAKRPPPPPPSAAERAAAHDLERPPPPPVVEEPQPWPVLVRLTLGVEGSIWFAGNDTKNHVPVTTAIDLGYVLSSELAILIRASTWLSAGEGDFANEFIGAGASYRFAEQTMYVTGALGLGITRVNGFSDFHHYVQGVTLQAEFGETWGLSDHSEMALGAQFQIGTPAGGTKPDAFPSLGAGLFLAIGLR
jgi:hypothetical protein